PGLPSHGCHGLPRNPAQVETLPTDVDPLFQARDFEHSPKEKVQFPRLSPHHGDGVMSALVEFAQIPFFEQRQVPTDEGHGRAQLVRSQVQELGLGPLERSHPVRVFTELDDLAMLGLEELVLHPFPFGDIAGDFGESSQAAGLVAERGDDDAGPETRSILAYAPAFGLEATLLFSNSQPAGRLSRGGILGLVEGREVTPNDFVGPIALDPLRTLVPTRHMTG